jgi:hypothetical protein
VFFFSSHDRRTLRAAFIALALGAVAIPTVAQTSPTATPAFTAKTAEPSAAPAASTQASMAPASSAAPLATPSGVVEPVLVPRGTLLVVRTLHSLKSYGSEAGAKITYEVVQDLIVDGHIIAQAGDVAEGAVQNAQAGESSFFTYKAANLRISVDTVYSWCGDTIHTDFVRSEYRRRQGFLGSNKDVDIVKGQLYQVPTERPQRVCGAKTTEQSLPIPSAALPGDKD